MPLVPAKCTSCGAQLEISPDLEAAVCPYCKAAYIVEKAIEIYASSNDFGLEKILKNAGTFIQLNETEKAFAIYKTATSYYPEDYRGWLGLATIITGNFNEYPRLEKELQQIKGLFSKIVKTAPSNTKDDLAQQLDGYVATASRGLREYEEKNQEVETELSTIQAKKEAALLNLPTRNPWKSLGTIVFVVAALALLSSLVSLLGAFFHLLPGSSMTASFWFAGFFFSFVFFSIAGFVFRGLDDSKYKKTGKRMGEINEQFRAMEYEKREAFDNYSHEFYNKHRYCSYYLGKL